MTEVILQPKLNGRLHRFLDDSGQGITLERNLLPDFLVQANALVQAGHSDEAKGLLSKENLQCVQDRVAQDPSLTDLMYVLAKLLNDLDRPEEAQVWYERIIEQEEHAQVLLNLAELCPKGQALEYRRRAFELDPSNAHRRWGYAESLLSCGRIKEGMEQIEKIIDAHPQAADMRLGTLWNRHYLPGFDRTHFRDEYLKWAKVYFPPPKQVYEHHNDPDLERPLRLGVVSGNFLNNSVMTPFELIFDLFDRDAFKLYAYSNVTEGHLATEAWKARMDVYRDIADLDDDRAAAMVHEDRIDILLEVGGYCSGSRLGVFIPQPAPVQVDYGALSTLGLPQVDFRISCPILDPPEALEGYPEETVYLSPMCPYAPPTPSPAVGPLPAKTNGFVTFGAFNNNRKVNAFTLNLWARILGQVPEARLIMKFPDGHDPDLAAYYRQQLVDRGVAEQRITIHGETEFSEHLALLGQCDLMLDTYPYNAARGTMEALWMGVPTVTLTGDIFVAREGLAIQSQVGLEIFAAQNAEEYVAKAVNFARQWDALETIRLSLRAKMVQSPLCDPRSWTKRFEGLLRSLWRRWCESLET